MSGDDDCCPLCVEPYELADQSFEPCPCGFQICVFCWNRIREVGNGQCPGCRSPYSDTPRFREGLEAQEPRPPGAAPKAAKAAKQPPAADKPGAAAAPAGRRAPAPPPPITSKDQLRDVRVVQRHLVYVIGLSPGAARDSVLRKHEYFGQYGRVVKVVVNKTALGDGGGKQAGASAYVTYHRELDARNAVLAVDGAWHEGRALRASFGTTKYCHAWLRDCACTTPDCLYLHEVGDPFVSFSRDEMSTGNGYGRTFQELVHPALASIHNSLPSAGTVLAPSAAPPGVGFPPCPNPATIAYLCGGSGELPGGAPSGGAAPVGIVFYTPPGQAVPALVTAAMALRARGVLPPPPPPPPAAPPALPATATASGSQGPGAGSTPAASSAAPAAGGAASASNAALSGRAGGGAAGGAAGRPQQQPALAGSAGEPLARGAGGAAAPSAAPAVSGGAAAAALGPTLRVNIAAPVSAPTLQTSAPSASPPGLLILNSSGSVPASDAPGAAWGGVGSRAAAAAVDVASVSDFPALLSSPTAGGEAASFQHAPHDGSAASLLSTRANAFKQQQLQSAGGTASKGAAAAAAAGGAKGGASLPAPSAASAAAQKGAKAAAPGPPDAAAGKAGAAGGGKRAKGNARDAVPGPPAAASKSAAAPATASAAGPAAGYLPTLSSDAATSFDAAALPLVPAAEAAEASAMDFTLGLTPGLDLGSGSLANPPSRSSSSGSGSNATVSEESFLAGFSAESRTLMANLGLTSAVAAASGVDLRPPVAPLQQQHPAAAPAAAGFSAFVGLPATLDGAGPATTSDSFAHARHLFAAPSPAPALGLPAGPPMGAAPPAPSSSLFSGMWAFQQPSRAASSSSSSSAFQSQLGLGSFGLGASLAGLGFGAGGGAGGGGGGAFDGSAAGGPFSFGGGSTPLAPPALSSLPSHPRSGSRLIAGTADGYDPAILGSAPPPAAAAAVAAAGGAAQAASSTSLSGSRLLQALFSGSSAGLAGAAGSSGSGYSGGGLPATTTSAHLQQPPHQHTAATGGKLPSASSSSSGGGHGINPLTDPEAWLRSLTGGVSRPASAPAPAAAPIFGGGFAGFLGLGPPQPAPPPVAFGALGGGRASTPEAALQPQQQQQQQQQLAAAAGGSASSSGGDAAVEASLLATLEALERLHLIAPGSSTEASLVAMRQRATAAAASAGAPLVAARGGGAPTAAAPAPSPAAAPAAAPLRQQQKQRGGGRAR